MIVGQLLERAAMQAIDPRVSHVEKMGGARLDDDAAQRVQT
jgi:hypothetical protein